MIIKIYALIWLLGLMIAGIFYLTGNLTPMVQIVFGFLTVTMVFMGVLSVLPTVLSDHTEPKH